MFLRDFLISLFNRKDKFDETGKYAFNKYII